MTTLVGTWGVGQYARRSFLRGAASAFDLSGNTTRQFRLSRSPAQADAAAVAADWETVGQDLRLAIDQYEPNHSS